MPLPAQRSTCSVLPPDGNRVVSYAAEGGEAQETVAASKSNLRFKPNLKDLKEVDDSEEEDGLSDEEVSGGEGSESELEDDMNGKR